MKGKDALLCSLLDCGVLDLEILNDVQYDMREIVDEIADIGVPVSLNVVTDMIFRKGQEELEDAVLEALRDARERLDEAEEAGQGEETGRLMDEVSELELLDVANDIEWYCNYLDTSIWFAGNERLYRERFGDMIGRIEQKMGFEFVG